MGITTPESRSALLDWFFNHGDEQEKENLFNLTFSSGREIQIYLISAYDDADGGNFRFDSRRGCQLYFLSGRGRLYRDSDEESYRSGQDVILPRGTNSCLQARKKTLLVAIYEPLPMTDPDTAQTDPR